MKKNLIAIMALLMLAACSAQAADELFRAKEWSVRIATINPQDLGGSQEYDLQAKSLSGYEVGLAYHFNRWAGAEAAVPVWRSDSRCFQGFTVGPTFRLPMDMLLAGKVWSHLAPYARVGLSYNECQTSQYSYYAGGGLEVRINRQWGIFGGAKYSRRNSFEPGSWDNWGTEAGLRIAF